MNLTEHITRLLFVVMWAVISGMVWYTSGILVMLMMLLALAATVTCIEEK